MIRININLILPCCKTVRKKRCLCKRLTSKQACDDSLNTDLLNLLEHINKDATKQALKDLKESWA